MALAFFSLDRKAAWAAALLALVELPEPTAAASLRQRALNASSVVFGAGGPTPFHWLHGADLARFGENLLVDTFLISIGLAITALIVLCLWSAVSQWCHWAHFRACERKVKRANEAFGRCHGEFPLCPYCVEPLTSQPSPSKVVFLCGHRFHTHCCNAYAAASGQSDSSGGHCPICQDSPGAAAEAGSARKLAAPSPSDDDSLNDGCEDEAQTFLLASLHKQFPDIITEACMQRWAKCHTQIWLSELSCPRQKCIMHKRCQG